MHEADYLGSVKIAFCFPFKMVHQDLNCVNSWLLRLVGFFFPFSFSFFSLKQLQANEALVTVLNSPNTGKKEN